MVGAIKKPILQFSPSPDGEIEQAEYLHMSVWFCKKKRLMFRPLIDKWATHNNYCNFDRSTWLDQGG